MLEERTPLGIVISSAIAIGILLAASVIVGGLADPIFFAPLPQAIAALGRLSQQGQLATHLLPTLAAFAGALIPALILGIAWGVAVGLVPAIRLIAGSLVAMLASSPLISVAPVMILAFGFGLPAKIAVGFVAALFPIANKIMNELARSQAGATQPARAPNVGLAILAGARVGVAACWAAVIIAEMIASQ